MKGYVISYIYHDEVADGMPHAYRQHDVPNIHDDDAISAQVRSERDDVPDGSYLDWTL
jgi:hypothetical protein